MRHVEPGDLPVPAGEGEFELRLDDRQRAALGSSRAEATSATSALQIDAELLVEIRLGRARVERRQAEPGDDEDRACSRTRRRGTAATRSRGVERLADGRQPEPAAARAKRSAGAPALGAGLRLGLDHVAEAARGLDARRRRASCAGGRRRPRWCWSRGRNPGRRDARRSRCARRCARRGASDRRAGDIRGWSA